MADTKSNTESLPSSFFVIPSSTPASEIKQNALVAKDIYSGAAMGQLLNIFQKYDAEKTGFIEAKEFPRMCCDLGLKPWRALKEMNVEGNNNKISLSEFVSWWFSSPIQFSRQQEDYAKKIFDTYDKTASGFLDQATFLKLAKDMGTKPWSMLKQMDLDGDQRVSRKEFVRWWFSSDNKKVDSSRSPSSPNKAAATRTPAKKSPRTKKFASPAAVGVSLKAVGKAVSPKQMQRAEVREAMANLQKAVLELSLALGLEDK